MRVSITQKDRDEVIRVCRSKIKTNTKLPWAIRISSNAWVLASERGERFTVRCRNGKQHEIEVQAPLGTIHIERGCSAYNKAVVLTAQIEGETIGKDISYLDLPLFNVSDATVWGPLVSIIPSLQNITLPTELKDVESVPTITVLQKLRRLDQTEEWKRGMPLWLVGIIAGISGFVLMLSSLWIFCYCRYK